LPFWSSKHLELRRAGGDLFDDVLGVAADAAE
jgi:hypothetical protein